MSSPTCSDATADATAHLSIFPIASEDAPRSDGTKIPAVGAARRTSTIHGTTTDTVNSAQNSRSAMNGRLTYSASSARAPMAPIYGPPWPGNYYIQDSPDGSGRKQWDLLLASSGIDPLLDDAEGVAAVDVDVRNSRAGCDGEGAPCAPGVHDADASRTISDEAPIVEVDGHYGYCIKRTSAHKEADPTPGCAEQSRDRLVDDVTELFGSLQAFDDSDTSGLPCDSNQEICEGVFVEDYCNSDAIDGAANELHESEEYVNDDVRYGHDAGDDFDVGNDYDDHDYENDDLYEYYVYDFPAPEDSDVNIVYGASDVSVDDELNDVNHTHEAPDEYDINGLQHAHSISDERDINDDPDVHEVSDEYGVNDEYDVSDVNDVYDANDIYNEHNFRGNHRVHEAHEDLETHEDHDDNEDHDNRDDQDDNNNHVNHDDQDDNDNHDSHDDQDDNDNHDNQDDHDEHGDHDDHDNHDDYDDHEDYGGFDVDYNNGDYDDHDDFDDCSCVSEYDD